MTRAYWLSALLLLAACGESGSDPVDQSEQEQRGDDDDDEGDDDSVKKPDDKGGKPDASKPSKVDAGTSSTKTDGSTPSKPSDDTDTKTAKGLPCDVQAIVDTKCTECHQGSGKFGAPMGLEDWDDFQAKNDDGRAYYEGALKRITGEEKPLMPPAPHSLSAEEKSAFSKWLMAKAPKSADTCESSGPSEQPTEISEDDIECDVEMDFKAGFDKPFTVPTTPDYYHCFYFKPEFPAGTVGKGFLPRIDNDKVIHHWLLFVKDDASKKPGTSEQCTGVNPGATLIAGWAPGGEPTTAPADVGIQLPQGPNTVYQLELHYNNTVGPSATDASGVKLCATTKKQKELAAIHYLGSENILVLPNSMGTAQSTCTPKQAVTLLSVNPHMHKTGHHAKMVIKRKSGAEEIYHDAPFSFESQVNYVKMAKLEVGDKITSSCTFKNDTSMIKTFQEGTNDEMCYLFTLAYPIGAMDTGSDLLGVGLPGPNRCMR